MLTQNRFKEINANKTNKLSDSRFELKYCINYFQYLKVVNAITPYMEKDIYTQNAPDNRYLVRSLYFDSSDYKAYEQKMSGDCNRVKFRLRAYQKTLENNPNVRVELKIREGNAMRKKSVFVPIDEYQYFMIHNHWKNISDPITTEFERQRVLQNLKPVILIEYDREGYKTRIKSDLRITFDHQVRSLDEKDLFSNNNFFQRLYPKYIVMEIKFANSNPQWLSKLVKNHGLKVIAFSKYTRGLQIGRHNLYHPGHVVLVR
jgi:hypothetical protein